MNLRRTSKRFNGLVAIDIHCGNAPDAIAINDSGQVVGSSVLPNGEGRAFLWDAGSMRDLGTLGGDWSAPSAVSATGQVVGQSTVIRGAPDRHAFLWENGVMRDLGTLGGSASGPGGTGSINDAGETVGPPRLRSVSSTRSSGGRVTSTTSGR